MLKISAPIGATTAKRYHKNELTSSRENYYSMSLSVHCFWAGNLAREFGLEGPVDTENFHRLAEGRHPQTGDVLVRETAGSAKPNGNNHRAAWDMTISAPKSVSITAILGGRPEVFEAHREAVLAALEAIEEYAQARLGGSRGSETTGNLAFACFEHDTSRPPDNEPGSRRDVQLHTHCLAMNMTRASDKIRSVQPVELFRTQALATAVYRSVLADRLQQSGYVIEIDQRTGAPEIAGYSAEYLRAASQRSDQIDTNLAKKGIRRRARTAERAVRIGRARKGDPDPAEVRAAQLALARKFGDQHVAVIERALARGTQRRDTEARGAQAYAAVVYALADQTYRSATSTRRDVMKVALRAGMAKTGYRETVAEFAATIRRGDVVTFPGRNGPDHGITTREMIELEEFCVARCLQSRGTCAELLPTWESSDENLRTVETLSAEQRRVFAEIGRQRDQIYALQGSAGVGKTRLLGAIALIAKGRGLSVAGLAPSGVATNSLESAGISAQTLQGFLAGRDRSEEPRLFIVDESSLASTRMIREFLQRLGRDDRVLLVGDVAQHESVEAGKVFAQLQEAGIGRSMLGEILRQEDLNLRAAVGDFARTAVAAALARMTPDQFREVQGHEERFQEIADEYAKDPERSCVVAPTHHERREITLRIRERLERDGLLGNGVVVTALDPRNDCTGPALTKAYTYREGEVIRYRAGSKEHGIPPGSYARVEAVDEMNNVVAVKAEDGHTALYDPSRLHGVEIYRERERTFAKGDRVLVTLGDRKKRIKKNTGGWIVALEGTVARVRFDDGRTTTYDLATWRHIDHGYVLTSHASQSITTPRVLVHVDTSHGKEMVNQRFGYVATSRAVHDAVIFTDRRDLLLAVLAREHSNTSAIESLRTAPDSARRDVEQAPLDSMDRGLGDKTGNLSAAPESSVDVSVVSPGMPEVFPWPDSAGASKGEPSLEESARATLAEQIGLLPGAAEALPAIERELVDVMARELAHYLRTDAPAELIATVGTLGFQDMVTELVWRCEAASDALKAMNDARERLARCSRLANAIRVGGEELVNSRPDDELFEKLVHRESLALGAWVASVHSSLSPPCDRHQILGEALDNHRNPEARLVLACLRARRDRGRLKLRPGRSGPDSARELI